MNLFNDVKLIGRLTEDATYYPEKDGKTAFTKFQIAVFHKQSLNGKDCLFVPIRLFGKTATYFKDLKKGKRIFIKGTLAKQILNKDDEDKRRESLVVVGNILQEVSGIATKSLYNSITLIGNVTSDVEVKSGNNGNIFAPIGIAINVNKDKTDFFNLVAFKNTIATLEKVSNGNNVLIPKGSRIVAECSFTTNKDNRLSLLIEQVISSQKPNIANTSKNNENNNFDTNSTPTEDFGDMSEDFMGDFGSYVDMDDMPF